MDGYGGPIYCGSGCFHRREILCGRKYDKETKIELKRENDSKREESLLELEETSKALASCTYETNTQWGKEVSISFLAICVFFNDGDRYISLCTPCIN